MSFEYPKNVRFACNGCALCCGDTDSRVRTIALLEDEVKRISEATSRDIQDFAEKMHGLEPYAYLMRKDDVGKCLFLMEKRCSIYPIRPLVCEFYPFELLVGDYGKHTFNYTCECPNMGKGDLIKKAFFERLFKKSSSLFNDCEQYEHNDARQA